MASRKLGIIKGGQTPRDIYSDPHSGVTRNSFNIVPQLNVRYIHETQQGLSYARNTGIAQAQGAIIAFLDDDAIAAKHYCQTMVDFFNTNPQAMVIGGRIFPKFETAQPAWMPRELTPLYSTLDLGNEAREFKRGKYPIGANMAFRNYVFQECGTFNVALGRVGKNLLGGEEKDMFFRIREKRMKVFYLPQAWVFHIIPTARTTKEFIKRQAIGSGQSERVRCAHSFFKLSSAFTLEIVKWGASLLLALKYFILGKFKAALTLVQFRYWVSKGLICNSTDI